MDKATDAHSNSHNSHYLESDWQHRTEFILLKKLHPPPNKMSTAHISRSPPFAQSSSHLEQCYSHRRFPLHNNMNSSSFIFGANDIGPRYLHNLSKVFEMKNK